MPHIVLASYEVVSEVNGLSGRQGFDSLVKFYIHQGTVTPVGPSTHL
jgi:hypothetical protein